MHSQTNNMLYRYILHIMHKQRTEIIEKNNETNQSFEIVINAIVTTIMSCKGIRLKPHMLIKNGIQFNYNADAQHN